MHIGIYVYISYMYIHIPAVVSEIKRLKLYFFPILY